MELTAKQWKFISAFFPDALELTPEDRTRFVSERCGDHPELVDEVLSLLAAHDLKVAILNIPISEFTTELLTPDLNDPPPEIDQYRIINKIGEGGMARVYLAEQIREDFRRIVAVKVLGESGSSNQLFRRFLRERQILANLTHPNIARLYDGGLTRDGEPFISMEFVEGSPVTDYCATRQLDLPERLRLFLSVCDAVSYAHRNLIVHRDLKPSNILVTADGVPKLLDFGIAKILTREVVSDLTQTQPGDRMLTPAYASPEQMRGDVITTGTDVYSLGVILYQLLTGRLPYVFADRTPSEALRLMTETVHRRPSTLPYDLETARKFGLSMTPKRLRKLFSGDLDTILARALRKDPAERYASVEQLAEDIENHLAGRPIRARADSIVYRTRKFLQRNRWQTAAAAIVLLSTTGGIGTGLWQGYQARLERERATAAQNLYTQSQFDTYDLVKDLSGATPVREKIIKDATTYLSKFENDAVNNPELAAKLAEGFQRLGEIQGKPKQGQIGDIPGALVSYQKAKRLYERVLETRPGDAEARLQLAAILEVQGQMFLRSDQLEQAKVCFLEALKYCTVENPGGPSTLAKQIQVISIRKRLGDTLANYGEIRASLLEIRKANAEVSTLNPKEAKVQEQIASLRARIVLPYRLTVEMLDTRVGKTSFTQALKEAAVELQKQHLALCQDLERQSPTSARYRSYTTAAEIRLGNLQLLAGLPRESLANCWQGLRKAEGVFRADPANSEFRYLLANAEFFAGEACLGNNDPASALKMLERAEIHFETLLKSDQSNIELRIDSAKLHITFGDILERQGNLGYAIPHFNRALEIIETLDCGSSLLNSHGNLLGFYDILSRKVAAAPNEPNLSNCLRRLISIQRRQTEYPDAPPIQFDIQAWILMTCPLPDVRNPDAARAMRQRSASKTTTPEPAAICVDALLSGRAGNQSETEQLVESMIALFPEIKMENRETATSELVRKFSTDPMY
jgi:eukaryotic-like serine/threonine-protein kinase